MTVNDNPFLFKAWNAIMNTATKHPEALRAIANAYKTHASQKEANDSLANNQHFQKLLKAITPDLTSYLAASQEVSDHTNVSLGKGALADGETDIASSWKREQANIQRGGSMSARVGTFQDRNKNPSDGVTV